MNNKQWDVIWINSLLATFELNGQPYGLVPAGAIAVKEGQIAWVGPQQDLPGLPTELAAEVIDGQGRCITPGLIDCHTHLVYAGNRSHEFVLRLQGATYEEIARAGGGIHATVQATRAAGEETLLQQSLIRARAMLAQGITTVEIKSGYGLDLATELKMLRVAKRLGEILPLTVRKTFLGAHTVPKEYQGQANAYIDFICAEVLPRAAELGLADAVDVFCETIGFDLTQTERLFQAAKKYGLAIKCHAEQLTDSGGAALAAQYNALSADHLECLSVEGVEALAAAGTVAVLLPGAFYYLREKRLPPIDLLRQHQVPLAIATDCNPGTSPLTSLLLALNMACVLFNLTPEEALTGATRHAAQALGLAATLGTLKVGKQADFVWWDVAHPVDLVAQMGLVAGKKIVKHGQLISLD